MKRKFFGMLLMGAMAIASVGMFTSCKDYDDDINNLQKQIDGITAQNLQSQLTTLQGALTTVQGSATAANDAAKAAKSAADAAAEAAKKAQGTADEANAAAEAATKLAQAAQATADAAAKASEVQALKDAINDLQAIVDGKVSKADFDEAIKGVEAKIAAIDEKLLTLDDVKKLLDDADFAKNAVIQDLIGQINALNEFKKSVEAINPIGDAAWKKSVDDAIASLEGIKSDIAAKADAADVKDLQDRMKVAEDAILALNELKIEDQFASIRATIGDIIEVLNIYVDRDLKSIVLRPDTYYGGIEGVSIYTYLLPEEKNNPCNANDKWRYFEHVGDVYISDFGKASYHVNPSNVNLKNFKIDFYNWIADVKEPAAKEGVTPTRSGEVGIEPVYDTTDKLFEANANALENGILTVPFKANAKVIEDRLKAGKATIASLSLTKVKQGDNPADTTVNSDYAIVVPEYGYGLLIGDNTWENDATPEIFEDKIGLDKGGVNNGILHRNFSFLALAATSPTHSIKYDESFDITAVLESRIVKQLADWEAIKDTATLHANHAATAKWKEKTLNPDDDSNATIAKNKVKTLTKDEMKKLGLTYQIELVDYVLGSNKTGESVHMQLKTDSTGHVIAYPRNVKADGTTDYDKPVTAACVGRQPIVCIMVKHGEQIVSFAYMKFLITQEKVTPEAKEVEFTIDNELWVNCAESYDGRVTWSQVERHLLDEALEGMSKKDFDNNYIYDYYFQTKKTVDIEGATYNKVTRLGIQYDGKGGKRLANPFGIVAEEWNESAQGVEDATTHIIKWSFTATELRIEAEKLKNAGKLEDKGEYYANKEPYVTWVRYAHLEYDPETDAPAVGAAPEKGNPSIWVKLTLPAGAIRVAKGDMGANKILTYWYDLNSKTNATSSKDAYEVRVNVPVPVPEASATVKTIGYDYPANATKLDIRYDNLLEKANDPIAKRSNNVYTEFTKNLKDFFIGGKLSATITDKTHFGTIDDMKLGCEFVLPSTVIGNATFDAGKNTGKYIVNIDNSWVVNGYTGAEYTLILNADRTKIQIKAKDNIVYPEPVDLITLNYDENAVVTDRQITVVNYVNGVDQDDILNYMTHNELGERETFTAYISVKATNACAPVYWNDMWFNVRFLRPLDLENPKQGLVPDAPNDWHTVDLTDALIVKDWREYYGDRLNRTGGQDVSLVLPSVGNQKAFDYAYYQVELDITENVYYTDANLGTSQRSDNYTLGHMPVIESEKDAKAKGFILTSEVPNLKLEKIGKTTLRYLNNSGVTGGFHVYIPITMTYVYGFQTVRQTKWVTVGVTASVEQAMFE